MKVTKHWPVYLCGLHNIAPCGCALRTEPTCLCGLKVKSQTQRKIPTLNLKRPEHKADFPTFSRAQVNSWTCKLISGFDNKAVGNKSFLNIGSGRDEEDTVLHRFKTTSYQFSGGALWNRLPPLRFVGIHTQNSNPDTFIINVLINRSIFNVAVFWGTAMCSPYTYLRSSETSAGRHIPEDGSIHNYRCRNLKS
jgi:hypothetical protein